MKGASAAARRRTIATQSAAVTQALFSRHRNTFAGQALRSEASWPAFSVCSFATITCGKTD
jgi:hypothetical protein